MATSNKMALKLQKNIVRWIKIEPDEAKPTLLILQHNPVYTIGIRDKQYTEDEIRFLESLGADFVKTDRGGLITFHGPGQLVSYPIFSQLQFPFSVKKYVCNLEKVIINVCEKFGIVADRSPHTGVWVGNNKICAMGINAENKIYSHGLALNCNTDMLWFSRIIPCGIRDKGVTSMTLQTGKEITVEDIIPTFLEEMKSIFKWDIVPLQEISVDPDLNDNDLFETVTKNTQNENSTSESV